MTPAREIVGQDARDYTFAFDLNIALPVLERFSNQSDVAGRRLFWRGLGRRALVRRALASSSRLNRRIAAGPQQGDDNERSKLNRFHNAELIKKESLRIGSSTRTVDDPGVRHASACRNAEYIHPDTSF